MPRITVGTENDAPIEIHPEEVNPALLDLLAA
jgi:hypothetical protein